MIKFTKISLVILFSIFLSACDQPLTPAENVPEKADISVDTQGAADFDKLLAWKSAQEILLNQAQNDLQQGLKNQDKTKIDEAFKAFQLKISDILKSLEELKITNPDVVVLKDKTKESLVLSNELISTWVNISVLSSPEVQKSVQVKAQRLIELGAELQQIQLKLQKKFSKQLRLST